MRTVAAVAARADWTDVAAVDTLTTTAYDNRTGCMVEIRLPNVTSRNRVLRVLYEPDDQPVLRSEWSNDGYAFDRPEQVLLGEAGEMFVAGLEASPEQYGEWAAQWFKRQLNRKVVRQEWDRPTQGLGPANSTRAGGDPVAVRGMVSDPERDLDSRGRLRWWRLMRQPPSRELVERG